MSSRPRGAVAAGTFYPADAGELASEVDRLVSEALPPTGVVDPVGLLVPHAGYAYSGPVAATAYSLLSRMSGQPSRVALLGPSHFVKVRGAAVPLGPAWATPLGVVSVDPELAQVARGWGAAMDDRPHALDHALEVQLPFLQRVVRSSFRILPVAIGESEGGQVATLIASLAEAGAFILVSTDLSHYHDHRTAQAIDTRTAEAVQARDAASIRGDSACGAPALRGVVAHAALTGLAFVLLDLRTSGDITGEQERVVGYGAFALVEGDHPTGTSGDASELA